MGWLQKSSLEPLELKNYLEFSIIASLNIIHISENSFQKGTIYQKNIYVPNHIYSSLLMLWPRTHKMGSKFEIWIHRKIPWKYEIFKSLSFLCFTTMTSYKNVYTAVLHYTLPLAPYFIQRGVYIGINWKITWTSFKLDDTIHKTKFKARINYHFYIGICMERSFFIPWSLDSPW